MSDDWRLVIPVRQVKRRLLQLITLATLLGSLIINDSPFVINDSPFECAEFAGRMSLYLSDHPKPANEYHLKTGQRE